MPSTALPACFVCGAGEAPLLYQLTRLSIYRCKACEQVFLWPLPSAEYIQTMFDRLYTDGGGSEEELKTYYQGTYDASPTNPLMQVFDRRLEVLERHHRPGTVLDIGCGTGQFLMAAKHRGWAPFGLDNCAEAITHGREKFGLDVQQMDFAQFAANGRTFDLITMWDIIEYARDPMALLRNVRRCLAPGGIIGMSTPNQHSILDLVAGTLHGISGGRIVKPLEKFYLDQHFLYFTHPTLRRLLARAGFDALHEDRELTDLKRLTLSVPMRAALTTLFKIASLTGLKNRLFAVFRPRAEV